MKFCIVTPWHNEKQRDAFLYAWGVTDTPDWLILQQDKIKEGCARTKNRGIKEAISRGAEYIVVLDDDCFPKEDVAYYPPMPYGLENLAYAHVAALQPQRVWMFEQVTDPASRGTPYHSRGVVMPVAASMGFWEGVPDWDAPSQLVHGGKPMEFKRQLIHGRYFALSGMNLSFHVEQFPWCQFVNVPRFDDIWMGFLFQKWAYAQGMCFNLNGPTVRHSRQSNVWANLREEAPNLERNETIWQEIHQMPLLPHDEMLAALNLSL